jgi:hypothetical protein
MGSFGCRAPVTDALALAFCLLALCAACTTTRHDGSAPAAAFEAGVELPAGAGREILVSECLNCHELAVLELFASFYDRDSWHELVISMRANGADVDDAEVELVSDYLAQHFGVP